MTRALRIGAVLVVIAFAGWYLTTNLGALVEAGARLDPLMVAVAGVLAIGYWLALGWLWGAVQAPLGGGLGRGAAMRVWALSTVARYVPGNIWHLAGRSSLAAEEGGRPLAVLSASAYEQVLTLAGAFVVAGTIVPFVGGSPWFALTGLAVPAALLSLHPGLNRWLVVRAARLLKQPEPASLPWRAIARLLALYTLPNLPAGLALAALGAHVGLSPVVAVGAFAFAWAIGYLSFVTPSGIGAREVAFAAALAGTVVAGDVAALALAHRVVLTIAELTVAIGAAVAHAAYRRRDRSSIAISP